MAKTKAQLNREIAAVIEPTLILWNNASTADRYAAITEALAAGRNVYVLTARGAIKITPKLAAKWTAAGRPVIKVGQRLPLAWQRSSLRLHRLQSHSDRGIGYGEDQG